MRILVEPVKFLVLSRDQRLNEFPFSIAKAPEFRICVLIEVFDPAFWLEERACVSAGIEQVERCCKHVAVARGKVRGQRRESLLEIGDEQERPHILFVKEVAMREVPGVQLSET